MLGKLRSAALAIAFFSAPSAGAEVLPVWNVAWSNVQRADAGVGLLLGNVKKGNFSAGKKAWLIEARPGLDGGALSVGFVPWSASVSGFQFAGVALKGTVLRTWGSPHVLSPDQTYLGGSLDFAVIVKGSIGVLHRVSGSAGKTTVFTWSVGLGL